MAENVVKSHFIYFHILKTAGLSFALRLFGCSLLFAVQSVYGVFYVHFFAVLNKTTT